MNSDVGRSSPNKKNIRVQQVGVCDPEATLLKHLTSGDLLAVEGKIYPTKKEQAG